MFVIVLDTDHLSVLFGRPNADQTALIERMSRSVDRDFATTVVNLEEVMRGWLGFIRSAGPARSVVAYERFQNGFLRLSKFQILPFATAAFERHQSLRKIHRKTGTQDLKIGAICLATGAKLLTANLKDFRDIDGLTVDDWLYPIEKSRRN